MDMEKDKDRFLLQLADDLSFEELQDICYSKDANQFYSARLADWFVDKINYGWRLWQAAKAQAVPEWISVEDSLPKKNTKVLLNVVARRRGKPLVCVGFYSIEPDDDPCFVLDDNFTVLKGVTHWMMLPQPPKAQEQDQ